jgi:hypothetical protein
MPPRIGLVLACALLSTAACSNGGSSSSTPSIRCGAGATTSAGCTCTFKGTSNSPVSSCSTASYPGTICCAYQGWPATTYADTAFCECDPPKAVNGSCGPQQQVSSCSSTTPILLDGGEDAAAAPLDGSDEGG